MKDETLTEAAKEAVMKQIVQTAPQVGADSKAILELAQAWALVTGQEADFSE